MIYSISEQTNDFLPKHFTHSELTHTLEYAIRTIATLKNKKSFFCGKQTDESKQKFFRENILPLFKDILILPRHVDSPLKIFNEIFEDEEELGQFWTDAALTSFQ